MTKLRQEIHVEQHQRVSLGTEAKLGISLLGMNALELEDFISNSIESNPFLTEDNPSTSEVEFWDYESDEKSGQEYQGFRSFDETDATQRVNVETLLKRMQPASDRQAGGSYGEVRTEYSFEHCLTSRASFIEQLESHLNLELSDPLDLALGKLLIGYIDSNGYLQISIEEFAVQTAQSEHRIQAVLKKVQSALPAGIGARTLSECLLLQVATQKTPDPFIRRVIQKHLDDVAAGRLMSVAAELHITMSRVQKIVDFLRTLDPRPGLQLIQSREPTVLPEVEVRFEPNQSKHLPSEHRQPKIIVNMLDYKLPSLRLDETYVALLDNKQLDKKTQEYLRAHYRAACGIIHGVRQRHETLHRITVEITNYQLDFFLKGPEHLRPLTMAELARLADVHESTVSRVVNGTYMQTPHGLFELRKFCLSGFLGGQDDGLSSESIKRLMRKIIDAEDEKDPLSDQALCEALKKRGILISRRTVNKYRQSLNIPSCAGRRRHNY